MEGVLSDGMCRCCATEGSFKDFQVAYQWMGVEEIYGNMLKDCFDITLSVSEEISNGGICEVCITQLRNACNFKQQVQRTEEKFQKKLQEASFKTEGIKMEISRFEDDDSNISADDFSSPEYEVPIKVEKVEEKPKKRAAAKASTSKAKKTKASEGEPSVKRNHQLIIKSEIQDAQDSHTRDKNNTVNPKENEAATVYIPNETLMTRVPGIIKRPSISHVTAIEKKPRVMKEAAETVISPAYVTKNKIATFKVPKKALLRKVDKKTKEGPVKISEKQKHVTNLEVVLAFSTATPIRSHDGFAYTCCFCTALFKNPAELKTHTLMTHDNRYDRREFMVKKTSSRYLLKLDITLLKCRVCDKSITTLEELYEHLQNEHKKLIYTDVKNLIIPFRFESEDLRCAICTLVFNKFKILLEHMKTHYRNYVCEICDYGCINQKTMVNHKQSHKTGSFECSECSKVFETHLRRRTHMNTVHKYKNMPAKCTICNERFHSGPMKDQHMVTMHGMSPIIRKCTACEKTFTNQNALRIHTKRYHLMERRYPCKECEMRFYTGAELKYHMVKHTGKKEFKCDICMKCFSRKWILSEHMHTHSNNRRFTCVECKQTFTQKCKLHRHIRSVHEEIDY
ncbi:oocyte zinc finger protein XlCOF6-like isoform X4 [Maniola hyperantus]|uniref:oocyte zinc finger protein XlCOF6-like isoform X4 n=1 Tax=Aphantopus hyperantus TaxID=2795564 RepID=UPI0037480F76